MNSIKTIHLHQLAIFIAKMELTQTHSINLKQKQQILRLWNNEYPNQLVFKDLEEMETYLSGLNNPIHFILSKNEDMLAWAVSFERAGERWFAIIVDSKHQNKGCGTLLLNALKTKEAFLCGWVTDHERYFKSDKSPYPSPLGFYTKNGFAILNNIRFENEKLSAVKIMWQSEDRD